MATKSFLTPEELQFAKREFRGDKLGTALSLWIEETLLARWRKSKHFESAGPIALGSWSRHELCPASDLDLLFVGPEEVVASFVREQMELGIRIRSRLAPLDSDWILGVEAFDVLALWGAEPLVKWVAPYLARQKESLSRRQKQWRRRLRQVILKERAARRQRYDSVTHYLEPNIKYGPGGIRDLQQAMDLMDLYPDYFVHLESSLARVRRELDRAKIFLHRVRQLLHLSGAGEILSASHQLALADEIGFKDPKKMMLAYQRWVAIVSFYSEWVLEVTIRRSLPLKSEPETVAKCLRRLWDRPTRSNQLMIYERVDRLKLDSPLSFKFDTSVKEFGPFLEALFHSHLIDVLLPEVTPLRGLVQHDHYHRFTADEHLLRVGLAVTRARRKQLPLFHLSPLARDLQPGDWDILFWTALFHDIGKGRGGDHSRVGRAILEQRGESLGFNRGLQEEVAWMVENHLLLSSAAFRGNPKDPALWRSILRAGARGDRLRRLSLFTAFDIIGTNPEAWSEWKSRLLMDLYREMTSAEARDYLALVKELDSQAEPVEKSSARWKQLKIRSKDQTGRKLQFRVVDEIDPMLAHAIPKRLLLKDIALALTAKDDLLPEIFKNRRGETWIRFHRLKDESGVFLDFVRRLYGAALTVDASIVGSLTGIGVYDWFLIRTKLAPEVLRRRLRESVSGQRLSSTLSARPSVYFERIEKVFETDEEVVLSFRGRDQKGLLLAAAVALNELQLEIRWAKVQTWGGQIDDVFAVRARPEVDRLIEELRRRLIVLDHEID